MGAAPAARTAHRPRAAARRPDRARSTCLNPQPSTSAIRGADRTLGRLTRLKRLGRNATAEPAGAPHDHDLAAVVDPDALGASVEARQTQDMPTAPYGLPHHVRHVEPHRVPPVAVAVLACLTPKAPSEPVP